MEKVTFGLLVVAMLAGLVVVAATPLVRLLARRVGALSYPKDDRWHTRPVPTLGGLAIFLGTVASLAASGHQDPALLAVVVAGSGMFTLGVVDDFLHLQPSTKLTGQIAVACVVIMLGHAPTWTIWEPLNLLLGIDVLAAFGLKLASLPSSIDDWVETTRDVGFAK